MRIISKLVIIEGSSLLYCSKPWILNKKAILILIPVTVSWLVIRNQKRSIAMTVNKTEKIKTINKKALIATLDIGKKVHYGYFRAPDAKMLTRFSFIPPIALIRSGKSFADLNKTISLMRLSSALNLLDLMANRYVIICKINRSNWSRLIPCIRKELKIC